MFTVIIRPEYRLTMAGRADVGIGSASLMAVMVSMVMNKKLDEMMNKRLDEVMNKKVEPVICVYRGKIL